jgi:hypothetical protein
MYSVPLYNYSSNNWHYGDDIYVENPNPFSISVSIALRGYSNVQFSVGGRVWGNETRKIGWVVCSDSSRAWGYEGVEWSWEQSYGGSATGNSTAKGSRNGGDPNSPNRVAVRATGCDECGDDGKVDCGWCGADGIREGKLCFACGGKGWIKCSKCGGQAQSAREKGSIKFASFRVSRLFGGVFKGAYPREKQISGRKPIYQPPSRRKQKVHQ